MASELKRLTASTLKWNTIDRVSSQVIYAVVGIVLANRLSKEDFGLVGVLTVFQAFAIIFVDSGFGAALLQKKEPRQEDYSTVFWFNLAVSAAVYAILFLSAGAIARFFHDTRLVAMSRVMFLSFVVNGLAIVQTNRLMKRMQMRPVAIANVAGLMVSGLIGILMAAYGCGAWALVWQTLSLAIVKTTVLWLRGDWFPSWIFSRESLIHIRRVGLSVFSTSLLNTIFQQIYNFAIGAFYSLSLLGVYTQADKWSKMGSASISQILTSSFVPLLSRVQDNPDHFQRYVERIDRFTALILLPFMTGLAVVGPALFHTLFGTKWDEAIPLFRILMLRGIFVVLQSLCNNYLLSLGRAKAIFAMEVMKDTLTAAALLSTIWTMSLPYLVWGQFAASAMTWAGALIIVRKSCGIKIRSMLSHLAPFAAATAVMSAATLATGILIDSNAPVTLVAQVAAGAGSYILLMLLFRLPETSEALAMLSKKKL